MDSRQRPNYGIDAPGVVRNFFLIAIVSLGLSYWLRFLWIPGVIFLGQGLVMVWGSKVGKFHLREKWLNSISWQGGEKVLDVGCGHGLMLIGAAKRLREGKATGIDLWQKEDQAGNSREATLRNVQLENVGDQVELVDGDARKLPFGDNTFDVVISSWALHNIYGRLGRETAIREIVRVLKPGGRLTIIDIRHTAEYAEVLRQSKMSDLRRTGPNFLFVIPTYMLTAQKAA
jgi:ubiquinone/menaquinone biosynthesis C-methylase UbiE